MPRKGYRWTPEQRANFLEASRNRIAPHGMTGTAFYARFQNIKARCNDPKSIGYRIYGARGIKCEWKDFMEFKNDMYDSYLEHAEEYGAKDTTLDRINNDGNYSKENCRWATHAVQNRNTRMNHMIPIIFFEDAFGVSHTTMRRWIKMYGTDEAMKMMKHRYDANQRSEIAKGIRHIQLDAEDIPQNLEKSSFGLGFGLGLADALKIVEAQAD